MYIYVFTFLFFYISRLSPKGFTERQASSALLLKFIWEWHPKRDFCPACLIAPAKGAEREVPRKRDCPFRQPSARVCKGRKTKKG